MGDHHHRHPGPGLFLEHFEDLHPGPEIEFAGRLVGEQDRVARRQGAGDRHALLFPTRQLVREVTHTLRQSHAFEGVDGTVVGVGPTGGIGTELDVLEGRQTREQVERLEDEPDLLAPDRRPFSLACAGHIDAGHPHRPRGRCVERPDHVQQRGLAAARGTKDDHERGVVDMQADPVDRGDLDVADPVALRHIVQIDPRPCVAHPGVDRLGWRLPDHGSTPTVGSAGRIGPLNAIIASRIRSG